MSKRRILTLGIAMGLFLSMDLQAFAGNALEKIEAYINNSITFTIDKENKELSEGYEVITYNNRTYVPIRFIAENLGAEVEWNEVTKNISITSEQNVQKYYADYKELPTYKNTENFKIEVVMYSEDEFGPIMHLSLENKTDTPIQLDQMATTVTFNDKVYTLNKTTNSGVDRRWYQDVHKDDVLEGYIRLPKELDYEEIKDFILTLKVGTNGSEIKKSEYVDFNIHL